MEKNLLVARAGRIFNSSHTSVKIDQSPMVARFLRF